MIENINQSPMNGSDHKKEKEKGRRQTEESLQWEKKYNKRMDMHVKRSKESPMNNKNPSRAGLLTCSNVVGSARRHHPMSDVAISLSVSLPLSLSCRLSSLGLNSVPRFALTMVQGDKRKMDK